MLLLRPVFGLCAVVAILSPAGPAAADVNLHEVVCFGDSLTDNQGILPLYMGNPAELYGHDPMQLVYDKNREVGDELSDYAVAGFTSDNVGLEVSLYEFNLFFPWQDHATLFQLEMGGNDILNDDWYLANNRPGTNQGADLVIDNIIWNWNNYVLDLKEDARRDAKAVFWTIPDISVVPRYYDLFSDEQIANIQGHTQRANAYIRSFDRFDNVVVLDIYDLLHEMVENPPLIDGHLLTGPPFYGETWYMFADEIHPTAVSNALIANELIALMNAKWDAGFIGYSEDELLDLYLNGGSTPAPAGLSILLGVGLLAGRRRSRPSLN